MKKRLPQFLSGLIVYLLSAPASAQLITTQPASKTICQNSTTTFQVTATGATGYKWQVSTTGPAGTFSDITDNSNYTGSSTATLNVVNTPASFAGNVYRVQVSNVANTVSSNSAVLSLGSTWAGGSSTLWSLGANWSCGVAPSDSVDVVIPSGTAFAPVIASAAVAKNITVATGATLSFSGSTTLTIRGELSVQGTFNANSVGAVVAFGGARMQTIPGGTYYNIQPAALLGATVNKMLGGDVTVTNNLNIANNSKLFLGNYNLVFAASATLSSGSAARYIATNGTGVVKKMGLVNSFTYQIGTATSYTPMLINNSGGVADNFSARIIDGVYDSYVNGVPQGPARTGEFVNKTWILSEDVPGGSNAQYIVQWNQTDELPNFVRSSSFTAFNNGNGWDQQYRISATSPTGPGPYLQTRNGVNTFGAFAVTSVPNTLPLKLLDFSAKVAGNAVAIAWKTAEESGLRNFEIERLGNNNRFVTVGTQAALNRPAGASYSFTDNSVPKADKVYYRLRTNEQDGTHTYSKVVIVSSKPLEEPAFLIGENPVIGSTLYVQVNNRIHHGQLAVYDMTGKKLITRVINSLGNERMAIDISGISAGTYLVEIKDDSNQHRLKFLKN